MADLNYGYGYNESNSIAIIWCIDDVQKVIEDYDLDIELSDDECMDVLGYCDRKHDANFGISWETIYWTLTNLYEDKLNKANKGVANG
jgi:hypothetical protein